jgi:hypothetical protein
MRGNKMSATIKNMELVWADKLTPGSLMEGDLIKVDGDLIEVISINSDSTGDNYFIEYADPYGEQDTLTILYDTYVDLYVYVDLDD